MTWTCEQTEARLSDYLDGILTAAERAEFDAHLLSCARCAPLVAGVSNALSALHSLEEIAEPPRLIYSILDKTLGPRDAVTGWRAVLGWLRNLASPRFAYGALSVGATFMVLVSATGFSWRKPKLADLHPAVIYHNADRQAHLAYARSTKFVSDLRVVYEIQSRLRQDNDLPVNSEGAAPKTAPDPQPGRTDGTQPGSPKQQNRANDLMKQVEVLAAEFPYAVTRRLP